MNVNLLKIIITLTVFLSINIHADEDEHSEHRNHEAHVHGQASINILIDETTFIFELNSPALNFLGFEHEPKTDEEKEIVSHVNNMLLDYKSIVSIPNMNCEQSQKKISAPYGNEEEHHDHHHGEKYDDDHSEYYLFYSLSCKNIKQIKIKLFDSFPGFENVDVKWTYYADVGSMDATKEQNIIKIK